MGRAKQTLDRRCVRYINHTYRRSGTLWEGRYHASLVQGDRYLLTCYRYIELNPVRANIAEGPAGYRWSSTPAEWQAVYGESFRVHIDPEWLKAVRQATHTNRVFGAEYFQKQIEAALAVRIEERKPGLRRREK